MKKRFPFAVAVAAIAATVLCACSFVTMRNVFSDQQDAQEEALVRREVFIEGQGEGSTAIIEDEETAAHASELGTPETVPDNLSDERAIIGKDNRKTISNTYTYPYSAIAEITAYCPKGKEYYGGTGFVVGKRALLTAAHVLWCEEHHCFCSLTFSFGVKKNGKSEYRYTGGYHYWYSNNYPLTSSYTSANLRWDYAYIRFDDKAIGNITGAFPLTAATNSTIAKAPKCSVVGYRDDLLKRGNGKVTEINDQWFEYNCDTLPGNSGGPVIGSDGKHVIAINVASDARYKPTYNCGWRITDNLLINMQTEGLIELEGSTPANAKGQIFPDSNKRRLTNREVDTLNLTQIRYAINEIFARRGYIFTNKEVYNYYRQFSWYKPRISKKKWESHGKAGLFNTIEYANVKKLEKRRTALRGY